MAESNDSECKLLSRLERRHIELLDQLDELSRRVELVLRDFTGQEPGGPARTSRSPSRAQRTG